MLKLLRAIIRVELNDLHQRRKILLLNYMALTGIISFLFLFGINVYNGSNPVFIFTNITGQIILYLTLYSNYKGFYHFARWFCFIFLLIFFNSLAVLLGKVAGIEFLNLLLCISSVVFFDSKKEIFLIAVLSLSGFIISRLSFGWMTPVLKNDNLEMIFSINMIILFICSFLVIFFFRNEFQRYTGIIEKQHEELTEKSNEINSSIRYARRIQNTLLNTGNELKEVLPRSFIFHSPKDVVGGDFYWYRRQNDIHYIVCADCTGHGVPGAFMCMIGITLLNEIINSSPGIETGKILDRLNDSLMTLLRQKKQEKTIRDGMEITVIAFNETKKVIHYSGANTSLFLIRDSVLNEIKCDQQPIGLHFGEAEPFTKNVIYLKKNDFVLLFTDGYADQFGGSSNKKMGYRRFREVCKSVSELPPEIRCDHLRNYFEAWKGPVEQLDDVCIVGLSFS